jgi:hypothetical protein
MAQSDDAIMNGMNMLKPNFCEISETMKSPGGISRKPNIAVQ